MYPNKELGADHITCRMPRMTDSPRLTYLDNNATTRVAPEVLDTMLPFLKDLWGNPSSAYAFGHRLGEALDRARSQVAALIGAEPREVVFTSGGTEANNTVLSAALASQPGKKHIVTTPVEHSAVLKFAHLLQKRGIEVTFLPVDRAGRLDLEQLRASIRPDTALVSVMWANNETGILHPVAEIARICHEKNTLFHTDAVQAAGKLVIDSHAIGVDFLSLSGHKFHAAKGVGALFVKRHTKFQPYVVGGGQERGRRGGTENVAGIAGFGKAAELALANLAQEQTQVRALRDALEAGILSGMPGAVLNGAPEPRLANTLNVSFEGVEAEGVLLLLEAEGICASSGSACTTGSLEPSHVLTAMGCSAARARGSLRFSLDIYNTEEDVRKVLGCLPGIIAKLRAHLPPRA